MKLETENKQNKVKSDFIHTNNFFKVFNYIQKEKTTVLRIK